MSEPIMQKLDEMQALTHSSSVLLGVSVARHTDRLLAETRLSLRTSVDALKAAMEEHREYLWHTEECTHWPDVDCNCIELGNGDWYEPHIGYFVCETCSGDVTCHGAADHAVEYPCPTVKVIEEALGVGL